LCPANPGNDTFPYQRSFKFRKGTDHGQHQSPRRRSRVNPGIPYRDELDAEPGQFVQDGQQVLQTAAKPVELPDDNQVKSAEPGIIQHRVKGRTGFLGTGYAFIDVFADDVPAPLLGNMPKLIDLKADVLAAVSRRYAGVHRCSQDPVTSCNDHVAT